MNKLIPHAIAVVMLTALASAVNAQDEAKLRERIDTLERDLARVTRELQELRAKVGDPKPGPKTADLLKTLDRAHETLRAEALDKELLIKAATSFERGDAKSALELLRKGRHPAAIPLILRDIVQRESRLTFKKEDIAGHLLALAILTGEDVEGRFVKSGSGHALTADWWQPNRDKLVTNIGKMTPAQLAHVARRLRDSVTVRDGFKDNGPSYYATTLVYQLIYPSDTPRGWFAEELHPALGPVFLDGMGYRPKGAGGEDIVEVPYRLVHILAAMRKNNALPQLDKIAVDETQNSGLRLVCLIALKNAGEGVRVPAVLSILARENNLDRKVTALTFLYYADDLEPAAPFLLEALDDPNTEVRQSALYALGRKPPARLLKRLIELSDAKYQKQVLEVIASVGTVEAQQYLADYLARTMQDGPKTERIHYTLWAFQRSVGQSWIGAGSYTFEQHHKMATTALKWWKENGGRPK